MSCACDHFWPKPIDQWTNLGSCQLVKFATAKYAKMQVAKLDTKHNAKFEKWKRKKNKHFFDKIAQNAICFFFAGFHFDMLFLYGERKQHWQRCLFYAFILCFWLLHKRYIHTVLCARFWPKILIEKPQSRRPRVLPKNFCI